MLKKAADRVLSPVVFQVIIIVATALMQVHILHHAFSGYLKYCLVFGVLVCLKLLFSKDFFSSLRDKTNIAWMCFAFLYAFSVFLNRNAVLAEGLKQLAYMVVFFVLLFMAYKNSISMKTVSVTVAAITGLLSFVSFLTLLLNINEWYLIDTEYFFIGTFDRFWGLYNPNVGGSIAVVSVIGSVYLFAKVKKEKTVKSILCCIVILVNIILQYLMIVFSGSRGALYSFYICAVSVVFLYFCKNFRRDHFSVGKRVVVAFVISGIVFGTLVVSSSFAERFEEKVSVVEKADSENTERDTCLENAIEALLKKYADNTSAVLGLLTPRVADVTENQSTVVEHSILDTSYRVDIWRAGFSVFLQKPVFGWTREGFIEPVNAILGETIGTSHVLSGGLHNIYLTVLCSSGVAGFVCLAVLAFVVFVRFARCLAAKNAFNPELLFSFAMCLYFFISEMAEARILYLPLFQNAVFWLYFGYLNYYSQKGIKKDA